MALNSKQQMFWINEKRKLSDLKPWERNPRQIKDKQAKLLAESFSDFGQVETIAISANGDIYNGHQRLSVLAGKYGMDYEVDVRVSSRDLTEKERERLTVYLHRGATGEWSWDELANWDMSDLLTWGFEESDFPFDVAPAMNEGADAEPQIDKAEELRQKWDVQSGQMWQLGEHRIICGDCTDRAVVERVMGGEKWNCIVTDPPYGVDYEGGRNPDSNKPREKLHGDGDALLYADFLNLWMDYRQDKSVVYMWFADKRGISVFNAVESVGLTVRAMIIWNKVDAHYGNFMAQYMQKHEPCLYCVKDSTEWYGATNEVTVWDIKQPTINEFHPTQKPIECMAKPITNSTKIGDIVAEPFSGSGTTLIACDNLSRKCRAVEISPAYVAVAIQRWVDVTGKEPILLDA